MPGATGRRIGALILGSALIAACGGTAPPAASGPPASGSGSAAASITPAASAPDGLPRVEFAATQDSAAAAAREIELIAELREEAGMAALLGDRADAVFAGLDAIQAAFAEGILRDLATTVDGGEPPPGSATGSLAGLTASLGGVIAPPAGGPAPAAIDVSLFAETGFTTSAYLTMLTGLVRSAGEDGSWTLPRQETHEQTIDGLRHQVELHTTITSSTGGGIVTVDVTISATDRIFAADGSFVALYTSTSTGHFEVNACPDANAIGAGTYTFTTRHELNDVGGSANVRATGSRSADAPFRLVDGEDAYLVRIEADLDLRADASGPGSPSGPGPTGPFDWTASQGLQLVMPAAGGTTVTGTSLAATGTGSERAGGAMVLSAGMAQLFFAEVARQAQTFWRSGECVELVPSEESRAVEPGEEIALTVEAKEKFLGGPIEKPMVATFTGVASLQPTDTPTGPPARFDFVAGADEGDVGTIQLRQTSIRGIGLKTIAFEVKPLELDVTLDGRIEVAGIAMDMTMPRVRLARNDDGVYEGAGEAAYSGTVTPLAGCRKAFSGSSAVTIRVRVDEADPDRATIGAVPGGDGTIRVPFDCGGVGGNVPVGYALFFGAFSTGTTLPTVRIGETTTLPIAGGQAGTVRVTLERPAGR